MTASPSKIRIILAAPLFAVTICAGVVALPFLALGLLTITIGMWICGIGRPIFQTEDLVKDPADWWKESR